MSDRLWPVGLDRLARLLDRETDGSSDAVLGLARRLIFRPDPSDPFRLPVAGGFLDTPIGVAAGPHSQMSQNIVAAWLMGARTIELKTVQTRDDIRVSRPCIAVAGEGYNCEWSQELPLEQSLRQYAQAWLLVHLLATRLGHPRSCPGAAFVTSVGYDLAGILAPNVQRFLDGMQDASALLEDAAREAAGAFPEARGVSVPPRICAAVTLSTMHGCPPQEVERIGAYLIEERGLDTMVKLNPTLLGSGEVRRILSRMPGCDARVPDQAFEHDLRYDQALRLIEALRASAARRGVRFGLKLVNTLEADNDRGLLPAGEPTAYMSGSALLPLGVRLAARLQGDFDGALDLSYCAGADCTNVADLLACGLAPVTACTDLLRPGGCGRLRQYLDELRRRFEEAGAGSIEEWILRRAAAPGSDSRSAALANLRELAARLPAAGARDEGPQRRAFKGVRPLPAFDCVRAPCEETCPAEQAVADYMYHAAHGDAAAALAVVRASNPLPRITGRACEAGCRLRCTRSNCDEALRIRDVKRHVSERAGGLPSPGAGRGERAVAVIGAGPSDLSCAAFLASAGVRVDVFDAAARPGGLPRRVIPRFRLSDEDIDADIRAIAALGVRIRSSTRVDRGLFERLRGEYAAVYVAVGAQEDRRLGIAGEDAPGVWAALDFLERSRAGGIPRIGPRAAVIGGGNSAVDAARVALRLVGESGTVTILYRRTLSQMPADREELAAARAEGASVRELVAPVAIRPQGCALEVDLQPMELGPPGPDGRPTPVPAHQAPWTERFDTVITALGQKPVLDFVEADRLDGREPGLLAGGDLTRGPASIILAVADGRRAANAILAALGLRPAGDGQPRARKYRSVGDQLAKVARRVWPLDDPVAEASRCLYCDEICNLCVTVCPNRANLFWESGPHTFRVQRAALTGGGRIRIVDEPDWSARQRVQVLTVADWCNECGNCATFCPTGGSPFKDKPRLCLSQASFAGETDANRLLLTESGEVATLTRAAGMEARLTPEGEVWRYEGEGVRAALDRRTLEIVEIALARPEWDSRQAAAMAYLAADLGSTRLGRWLAGG